MTTTVGTESRFDTLVTNLIRLEHDAIAAYETCIQRLDGPEVKAEIQSFLGDHRHHLELLNKIAAEAGIDAPEEGDMKQYLTTGKVALADIGGGDAAILRAMKTNEDDTVSAYERASKHGEARPETKHVFERAHSDELRHRAWMESAAKAA